MVQVVASLTINPEEPEALQKYFGVAMPLIEKAGGKICQRIELGKPIIGEQSTETVMLVDYPSFDSVERVFQSPEYKTAIPHRDKAFLKYNVCIVSKNEQLT